MGLTGTTSEERGLTIAHLYQRVCYMGLTGTTSEERGLTIAHLYQRVCYLSLTGTTSEASGLTIAHLYQRVCYTSLTGTTSGGTGLVYEFITGSVFGGQVTSIQPWAKNTIFWMCSGVSGLPAFTERSINPLATLRGSCILHLRIM